MSIDVGNVLHASEVTSSSASAAAKGPRIMPALGWLLLLLFVAAARIGGAERVLDRTTPTTLLAFSR